MVTNHPQKSMFSDFYKKSVVTVVTEAQQTAIYSHKMRLQQLSFFNVTVVTMSICAICRNSDLICKKILFIVGVRVVRTSKPAIRTH